MAFDLSKRLIAPCVHACPAEIDVPRYIGYVERGQFAEAHAVVRESLPLPDLCGLICYRPCEPWCRRGIMEQPVAINAIKRAAVEHDALQRTAHRWDARPAPPTGKRVAIVGSGPAGLTAAYYLASRRGHQVTLFEAMPELGGQLRIGLPEYKAPRDRLRREIEQITRIRVDVRTNSRVESLEPLLAEHEAVVLAIGHGEPLRLGIEGEDLPGVLFAADVLRDINLGCRVNLGSRVLIAGGNNIAFDAARCAVRLGSQEVCVVFPGPAAETPAHRHEVQGAIEEGVTFEPLTRSMDIRRSGQALTMELQRMEVSGSDDWGRARLLPAASASYVRQADTILISAGQRAHVPQLWGIAIDDRGFIRAHPKTQRTSSERVYAAGDAVSGPDSIVQAMAQGRRVAIAVDRALGGDGDIAERFAPAPDAEMAMPPHLARRGKPVVAMPLAAANDRRRNFALVERGYNKDEAIAEARRCIRCDLWRTGAPDVWTQQES